MEIEWDEEKDAQNRAKHGIGLRDAALLDWEQSLDKRDTRYDYEEVRMKTLVPLNGRIFACIYTMREGRRRIISLRKANAREVSEYGASR